MLLKLRLSGVTLPSVVLSLRRESVTAPSGWLLRRTVNWAVPPASVVLSLIALTTNPEVSSSELTMVNSRGVTVL